MTIKVIPDECEHHQPKKKEGEKLNGYIENKESRVY
jgi:hypothetical protein